MKRIQNVDCVFYRQALYRTTGGENVPEKVGQMMGELEDNEEICSMFMILEEQDECIFYVSCRDRGDESEIYKIFERLEDYTGFVDTKKLLFVDIIESITTPYSDSDVVEDGK